MKYTKLFDSKLSPAQAAVWNDMITEDNRIVVTLACRGFGKTYLSSRFIHRMSYYNTIGVITPVVDQYDRIINYFNLSTVSRIKEGNVDKEYDILLVDGASVLTEEDIEVIANFKEKTVIFSPGMWSDNPFAMFLKSNIDNPDFSVHVVPYTLLSEGYIDADILIEAKNSMSPHYFMMEYCATILDRRVHE